MSKRDLFFRKETYFSGPMETSTYHTYKWGMSKRDLFFRKETYSWRGQWKLVHITRISEACQKETYSFEKRPILAGFFPMETSTYRSWLACMWCKSGMDMGSDLLVTTTDGYWGREPASKGRCVLVSIVYVVSIGNGHEFWFNGTNQTQTGTGVENPHPRSFSGSMHMKLMHIKCDFETVFHAFRPRMEKSHCGRTRV